MTRKEFNLRRERLKRGLTQEQVMLGVPVPNRTYREHEYSNNFSELAKRGYKHFFEEFDKK